MMASSRCPKTGMKSGMKSTGITAYVTAKPRSILDNLGVLGSDRRLR